MPRIAEFYGIFIYMYYRDHAPPHVHAIYGEHEAKIDIATGMIQEGYLPRRAASLVEEWTIAHQSELLSNWMLAQAGQPIARIDPLE